MCILPIVLRNDCGGQRYRTYSVYNLGSFLLLSRRFLVQVRVEKSRMTFDHPSEIVMWSLHFIALALALANVVRLSPVWRDLSITLFVVDNSVMELICESIGHPLPKADP